MNLRVTTKFVVSLLLAMAFCALARPAFAQKIKTGLFTSNSTTHVLFAVQQGSYKLVGNEREVAVIRQGDAVYLSLVGEEIYVKLKGEELGIFTYIAIEERERNSVFKLLSIQPAAREQWYEGDLKLRALAQKMQLVNEVGIENYVGGVVEAETGAEQSLEFYKMQATICRTFALANLQKHAAEGFNVCDQVHCQVYKGKPRSNPNITKAVEQTADYVVVDRNLNLIDAVFHSNCGGQTLNSEEYWREKVSYLRSVTDPYCKEGLQARWKINIPKDKWLNYLQGKFALAVEDSIIADAACNFKPLIRGQYFIDSVFQINLKRIRGDWKLRSTYFDVVTTDEGVQLQGRGFGHGVGMCQEGAMYMSRNGFNYADILHFYFTDVFIIPRDQLLFIKDLQ